MTTTTAPAPAPAVRLAALDVLRGLTVAAMIVVNNPGNWLAVFPQLQHAAWNGVTCADLVFPFFVVIMGTAMPYALDARQARADDRAAVSRRVVTRAALLFAIGLALNAAHAWPDLTLLRVPGVLPRLALTYAIAALLVIHSRPKIQALTCVALLVVHWALLTLVPFGGVPAGIITPAHNLQSWIDHAIFGRHTLTASGDPEGLLGLLPSVSTALIGVFAGRWVRAVAAPRARVFRLVVGGTASIAMGAAWSTVWPMNKALWSGSYALFTAGLALVGLAAASRAVDASDGRPRWSRPFECLGVNALAIYAGAELGSILMEQPIPWHVAPRFSLKDIIVWRWLPRVFHDGGGVRSSLAYALAYTAVWMLVAGVLHRRRLIVRI